MWRIEYENVVTNDLAVEYLDGLAREEVESHAIKHSSQTGLVYGCYTVEEIKPEDVQKVQNKDFFRVLRARLNDYVEWSEQGWTDGYSYAGVAFGLIEGAGLARPDLAEEISAVWNNEYRPKFYEKED